VYQDTNPYGTFGSLLASPTGNTFTTPASSVRYFYKVKAERVAP
jgi:hypothetical protein